MNYINLSTLNETTTQGISSHKVCIVSVVDGMDIYILLKVTLFSLSLFY